MQSPSDSLKDLQAKMQEYIENGVNLGWLIDRNAKKVYIYRPDAALEVLETTTVSGDHVLRGFVLDLTKIW